MYVTQFRINDVKNLKPPCVFVVGALLPSLRVTVARKLVREHGLKPVEAARKMAVTPAAITQYLKGVRGGEYVDGFFERDDVKLALKGLLDELAKEDVHFPSVIGKICGLCQMVRREGLLCERCVEVSPTLKEMDCRVCR